MLLRHLLNLHFGRCFGCLCGRGDLSDLRLADRLCFRRLRSLVCLRDYNVLLDMHR